MLLKFSIPVLLIAGVVGAPLSSLAATGGTDYTPVPSISATTDASMLLATAYTNQTLPTLRRGNRGPAVRKLQKILQSNGYLGAANKRLGNPGYNTVDRVFGAVTESAIKDLQRRYKLPVTGVVDPTTWEVLDAKENPYRSPLPFKR